MPTESLVDDQHLATSEGTRTSAETNAPSSATTGIAHQSSRRKRRLRLSLRFFIGATLVATALLTAAAVFWPQWWWGRENTERMLTRQASVTLTDMKVRADSVIRIAEGTVSAMAVLTSAGDLSVEEFAGTARQDEMLRTILATTENLSSASFLGANLVERRATEGSDGEITLLSRNHSSHSGFVTRLLGLPRNDGPAWISSASNVLNPQAVMEVWRPAFDEGAFVGSWGVSISFDALTQVVKNHGLQKGSTAFLVRRDGRLLALPSFHTRESGSVNINGSRDTVHGSDDRVLRDLWGEYTNMMVAAQIPTGQVVRLEFETDGEPYVGFLQEIDEHDDVPWVVGVWMPAEDLRAHEGVSVWSALYASGMAVAIAILLTFWAAHRISGPISVLADSARRLSQLDLASLTPLRSSIIREVGDLSGSFNRMQRGLRFVETYMPRQLVHRFLNEDGAELQARERRLAVMFTDIEGFTKLSENTSPRQVAELLNEHFTILGEIVERHGGTIDKYIGDSLMAFWGAPAPLANPSQNACKAAVEIVQAFKDYEAKRVAAGKPAIRIRIGIHTGSVLVGNIGAPGRVNYTIVGDTVNATQRIESLAGDVISREPVTVLVSETVAAELSEDMTCIEVGTASLKGRKANLTVYKLEP